MTGLFNKGMRLELGASLKGKEKLDKRIQMIRETNTEKTEKI